MTLVPSEGHLNFYPSPPGGVAVPHDCLDNQASNWDAITTGRGGKIERQYSGTGRLHFLADNGAGNTCKEHILQKQRNKV